MTAALTYHTVTLEMHECGAYGCGVVYGLSEDFVRERRRDHKTWYCPHGHSRYFPSKSDVEKERDRRIQAEADRARAQDRLELQRRQTAAAKGQLTKVKNRLKNGVCPFCSRTFANLAAHMETKHSEDAPHG
jgi:hypothetical protein